MKTTEKNEEPAARFDAIRKVIAQAPDDPATGTGWREPIFKNTLSGDKTVTRTDTRAIVKIMPMEEHEKQDQLPLHEAEETT